MISEFLFLDIGLKTKTQISQKMFIFQLFPLKLYQIHFLVCLHLFLLAEFVIPLFNCFFHDFHGFQDFRVFDLLLISVKFLRYQLNIGQYWLNIG